MKKKMLHLLPGRLRLKVPGMKNNPQFVGNLNALAFELEGVRRVKANPLTGSLLVYFDPIYTDHFSIILKVEDIRNGKISPLPDEYSAAKSSIISIPEPEDLPVVWQIAQVLFSGAVLLLLLFKSRLFGRSRLAASSTLFNVASATTLVTGYPILHSGLQHLAQRKKISYDLVIGVSSLSLLILRESFTGLLITWLVNLNSLFQTLNLIKVNKKIKDAIGVTNYATVLTGDIVTRIPVHRLRQGDIILAATGDYIPVDGTIISGQAAVDESGISGEPYPVFKEEGSLVLSGSKVLDGMLKIKTGQVGDKTYFNQIVKDVQLKLRQDNGYSYFDNHKGDIFINFSLLSAGLIYLLTRNLSRSLAMLLAACPAPTNLAASTAIGAAIGNGFSQGLYIKDGKNLLLAGKVDTVVFDKTGTLTAPNGEVLEIIPVNKKYSEKDIISLASLAEGISGHPIAEAIREKAIEMQIGPAIAAKSISIISGQGVRAVVGDNRVLVGNQRLMEESQVSLHRIKAKLTRFRHLGLISVFVAVDEKLVGLLGTKEKLKPQSVSVVEKLRSMGVSKILLLTGDTPDNAEIVAKKLGIEVSYGDLEPQQKATIVSSLKNQGHTVLVVGDGINDAMAMVNSDVGMALGCQGMETAACAGGIVTASKNPIKVVDFLKLAHETREVVRQNYSLSRSINILGLALGAAGLITPISAGLFANIGTLVVLFNSMGLVKNRAMRQSRSKRELQRIKKIKYNINVSPVETVNWHLKDSNEVLQLLNSNQGIGLDFEERNLRITKYGPNQLLIEKKVSWISLLLEPFKDLMVQLLMGASVISIMVGEYADAVAIVAIIGVEALLGVIQGLRAEKSMAALKSLAAPISHVLVNGTIMEIKASDLVPGDIIIIGEGDTVPADCRLIDAINLEIEEASLTGESVAVSKYPNVCSELTVPLAERNNVIYMGTSVTKGSGKAIVVTTGMQTEMGRLALMLQESETDETPLQQQLEQLGRQLTFGCLAICGGVVTIGLLRGQPLMEMFRTGVSLAVGAIPEGLPAVVTIALAFGVQRMVKKNAIVRDLSAVETLGNATVICTDKTGTLTKNEMTVTEICAYGWNKLGGYG